MHRLAVLFAAASLSGAAAAQEGPGFSAGAEGRPVVALAWAPAVVPRSSVPQAALPHAFRHKAGKTPEQVHAERLAAQRGFRGRHRRQGWTIGD